MYAAVGQMGRGWVPGVPGAGRAIRMVVLKGTVVVVARTVGGTTVWRAVVERGGLARIGPRVPGKRVGALVMVVRRVLIRLCVLDVVVVVDVVVSMLLGGVVGLERKKGSCSIPLESISSVGTYSLTEPTTIHLSSIRLSPKPTKPMKRGTTHSHVCWRFHTMQSLQRTSRAAGSGPPSPSAGPPAPAAAPSSAAATAPGGEATPSLILLGAFHTLPRGKEKASGGREQHAEQRGWEVGEGGRERKI